jgi:hypothetical protein
LQNHPQWCEWAKFEKELLLVWLKRGINFLNGWAKNADGGF